MPRTSNRNTTQRNAAQDSAAENSMGQLAMEAMIVEHNPERGVLASADVKIGDILTVRNVRIKEDDYGLTVSMPRTKMPHTDQYKDSVFFSDKSLKEQFDQIVQKAYQDSILSPVLNDNAAEEDMEPEEEAGMNMGM